MTGGAEKTPITVVVPVFNLAAPPGVPAEFGFNLPTNWPVPLAPHVRVDGSYGLTVDSIDTAQAEPVPRDQGDDLGVPVRLQPRPRTGTCMGTMGQTLGSCPATGTPKAYLDAARVLWRPLRDQARRRLLAAATVRRRTRARQAAPGKR